MASSHLFSATIHLGNALRLVEQACVQMRQAEQALQVLPLLPKGTDETVQETIAQMYALICQHFHTTNLLVEQSAESLRDDRQQLLRFARIVQVHEQEPQTPSSDANLSQGC